MQINITNGTLTQIEEILVPDIDYVLPSIITVTGASSTYNSTTGELTLTSPTSTISITAEAQIQTYTITPVFTHVTSSNTNYIVSGQDTWTTILTPDAGYDLPNSVSISGTGNSSYNSTSGELILSDIGSDITLTVTATPSKPDISFGNLSIASMSFGTSEVSAVYFGSYKLY